MIYHVLNRGNGRRRLFHKPADYAAFEHCRGGPALAARACPTLRLCFRGLYRIVT
jgi:hypothetical protein